MRKNKRRVQLVDMASRAECLLHLVGEFHVFRTLRQPHRLEIVHAAAQRRAFENVDGQVLLAPIMGHHAAAEMRAGGMGREIKPSGITAKARGIAVDPGDCAAHLLDHGKQACAGVVHIRKVENDVMRPCLHERFGQKRVIGTAIGPPRATVDENVDRRIRRFGTVDVELLDLARPISHALRKP